MNDIRHLAARLGVAVSALGCALIMGIGMPSAALGQATAPGRVAFTREAPRPMKSATLLGQVADNQPFSATITLPLRNQSQLADLLRGLYNPSDPRYGHYLTPQQFADQFGPTQADYDQVIAFAKSNGLTVTQTWPNHVLLNVTGSAAAVERAFAVHLVSYRSKDGRMFHMPDVAPSVPASLGGIVASVAGLNDSVLPMPRCHRYTGPLPSKVGGNGPDNSGLTPNDTALAYNLSSVSETGAGQSIALFEANDYVNTDITTFETEYGITPAPNVQREPVDGGGTLSIGGGESEVVLDIDMAMELAPKLSNIYVYEIPGSLFYFPDGYQKIAADNLAKIVSTSWGTDELDADNDGIRAGEAAAFAQMATQGQTMFDAAGDSGANTDGVDLSVDDTASEPFVTGVGGTNLVLNTDGSYLAESSWSDPADTVQQSPIGSGGGGGVSELATIPGYQVGAITAASLGSDVWRNVPDVSLYGDYDTGGYSIYEADIEPYIGFAWFAENGTSAASPLWASFTALVNQKRVANGLPVLGFANPALYQIGQSPNYSGDFHDINDGSNNLYYPAVTGYDLSTGWGSFNGANLLADLTSTAAPPAPASLTAIAGNGQVTLTWTGVAGISSYNVYQGTSPNQPLFATAASDVEGTNTVIGGLANGTTYYFFVQANGSFTGGLALPSAIVPATPEVSPAVPAGVVAASANQSVVLTWTASSGAQSYSIYRAMAMGSEGTGPIATGFSGTTYTDAQLVNGTSYYYTVTAVGNGSESAQSAEVNAIPIATPKPRHPATIAPSSLTAGLVLCAPIDEFGGTSITNLVDGTQAALAGGWTWTNSSPEGPALQASSPTQPIKFTPAAGVAPTGDMTIFVSGYANSNATEYPYFTQDQGAESSANWGVSLEDGVLQNYSNVGLANYAVRADAEPYYEFSNETDIQGTTAGRLVHLAFTRQSSSGTDNFYVNGAKAGSTFDFGGPIGSSTPDVWALGGDLDPTLPTLNGYLAYVLVWNRALSPTEIGEVNADPYALLLPPLTPSVPSDVVAQGVAGGVFLTWTASTNATGYNVLMSTSPGQETLLESVAGTSATATGLNAGQTYYFKIVAVDPAGVSGPSAEVSAVPLPPPPPAPANLTATPGNQQVILNWSGSAAAELYNVYEGQAPGGESATPLSPPAFAGTTTYTVTGLTNNVTYYFTVVAFSASGASAPSNEAQATPSNAPPSAPGGLTATAGNGQVTLAWAASTGAATYNVYEGTAAGQESSLAVQTGLATTGATVAGLNNGTAYYFIVRAVNFIGTGGASNEASATPQPPPPLAPGGLSASAGNSIVTLTWNLSAGATSYSVYEGTAAGGESSTAVQADVTGTSEVIGSLQNNTTYYFTVKAVNGGGTSNPSNEASATPQPPAPGAPTGVTATPGDRSMTLSWTAPANAATYDIYVGTSPGGEGSTPAVSGLTSATGTVTGLANGTTYYFTVTALNTGGAGPPSVEVSAVPEPPPPPAPTSLTATSGNGTVALNWTGAFGATSYNVYLGTTPGGEGATPYAIGITSTQDTVTGLTNGLTYYFTVTGVNLHGEGAHSNEAAAAPGVQLSFSPGVHFLSVPYDYPGVSLDTLFGYSPVSLYVWSPSQLQYIGTPNPPADALRIGVGYWSNLAQAVTFSNQVGAAAANPTQAFSISLAVGWNQIGDPFLTSAPISGLTFNGGETFSQATTGATPLIGAAIWSYDPALNSGLGGYVNATTGDGMLDVGHGYWVYATAATVMVVPHP